ncbi:MAG: methyl-accepting chemotaxis protein [bacterium]
MQSLPISVRLVGTFVLVLAVTSAGSIVLATRAQNLLALSQARRFAEGASHMAFAAVIEAMRFADLRQVNAAVDELERSGSVRSLHVVRGPAVIARFGPKKNPKYPVDGVEERVIREGQPFFGPATRDGIPVYRAVLPMIARADFLGANCTACHQVEAGRVLGALSLDVGLDQVVAENQTFQRTMLLATAGVGLLLALGVWRYCRSITRPLASTVAVLEGLAGGDLRNRVHVTSDDELGRMGHALNTATEKLRDMVIQIRAASQAITRGASEISAGNADLNDRTQAQASALGETAASVEEMTSAVRQSADSARHANQLVTNARATAENGGAVVGQTIAAMGEIDASSKRIAEIIGVIDGIAFQTNLLALNAAVEAARAGEQGRGFAVVAAEVRGLAHRSATAAKEIEALIRESVGKVAEGSKLVNRSGETLTEILAGVTTVSDIIGEIATASAEQAAGIEHVNQAVTSMDSATRANAALVEQSAAASESMADRARELDRLMQFFRTHRDDGMDSVGDRGAPAVAARSRATATAREAASPTGATEGTPTRGPARSGSSRSRARPSRQPPPARGTTAEAHGEVAVSIAEGAAARTPGDGSSKSTFRGLG